MIMSMKKELIETLSDREKYLFGITVTERWSPKEGMSSKGDLEYATKKLKQFDLLKD